jgi:ATP-dependent Lon protease
MSESVQAAFSFVKARSPAYGIKPTIYSRKDIHIHLPEGAVPKDGPSAGVGMVTSIVSTLTGIPVRPDVAMTGEVTLRGRVLAIGGLKEKALAAHRQGIRRVIAPKDNERDFAKMPAILKKDMQFVWAASMDQVIAEAIMLDDAQVGSLMEGSMLPASSAPAHAPVADEERLPPAAVPADVAIDTTVADGAGR